MLLHDIVFMALHIVYWPLFLLQIVTPDTVLSAINAVRCGEKMSLNLLLPDFGNKNAIEPFHADYR